MALTQRAERILTEVRDDHLSAVHPAGSLATATLAAARLADLDSAVRVLAEPARFTVVGDVSR